MLVHHVHTEYQLDPGPIDQSVLYLQADHRSHDIWHGQGVEDVFKCREHLSSIRRGWDNVDDRIILYVRQAGFYGVHRLSCSFDINRPLITALVERWRQETHTFHLTVGETTITLQDVAVLMGLRVHGTPVTGTTHYQWDELTEELLGVRPPPEALSGSALKLKWLRDNFAHLPANVSDETVRCFARAYILALMGGVLFADKSGNEIQLLFLPLLRDLEETAAYSWGSATLAHLYRQLCRASQRNVQQIGGPLILLQLWAWEHIHIGRPTFLHAPNPPSLGPHHEPGVDPLACKWLRSPLKRMESSGGLVYYRDALDHMRDYQFTWQPYTPEILSLLPPICREHHHVWCTIAPLICFGIIEMHQPDRVMRQFGFQQSIPHPCDTFQDCHRMDRRGKSNYDWTLANADYLAMWGRRENTIVCGLPFGANMEDHERYMSWYRTITRRWISSPTNPISNHHQPLTGDLHLMAHCLVDIRARSKHTSQRINQLHQLQAFNEVAPIAISCLGDVATMSSNTLQRVSLEHIGDTSINPTPNGFASPSATDSPTPLAIVPLPAPDSPTPPAMVPPPVRGAFCCRQ